ncbi:hypothetical protein OAF54_02845 [bacterium]|nr:hypothetical protein [bacterium]
MSTEGIVAIIGALTTALTVLIPLYFRERAKARAAETQRDIAIDVIEDAGPGPISDQIKKNIKKTGIAMGVDEQLSRAVTKRTSGRLPRNEPPSNGNGV